MLLYFIRHGIAIDREDPNRPEEDAKRPLTAAGEERTREAMEGLRALKVAPGALISSPFVRALQTAKIAAKVFRVPAEKIRTTRALEPEEEPAKIFEELAGLTVKEVLCFGHAPHLDRAIAHAVGARACITGLKKSGAACIEMAAVNPGRGELLWLATPRMLRGMG